MQKSMVRVAIIAAIAAAILFVAANPLNFLRYHRRELKVYFRDVQGLRAGASVRMAGVDVGSVVSVRVRPEVHDTPAEVTILLQTPYELKVPKDATVSVGTAGVLGPQFVEIDISGASGPPLEKGGVLKAKEGTTPTSDQFLDRLADIFKPKPCETGQNQAKTESDSVKARGPASQPRR